MATTPEETRGRSGYVNCLRDDPEWPIWKPSAEAAKTLAEAQRVWGTVVKTRQALADHLNTRKAKLLSLEGRRFSKGSVERVVTALELLAGNVKPPK